MIRVGRIGARHCVFACAIAMLLVSVIAGAAQAQGIAQATKLRGEVAVTRGGADQPVAVGMAFQIKDIIKTGAKARVQIGFADGSVVTLAENSALSIDRFTLNAGTSRSVTLSALAGVVDAVATKSAESKFDYQVKTAQGYSAVRGTHWIIAVQAAISTFVVVDGLVEVGTMSGSRTVVEAGKSVTVSSESGLGAPQPVPPEIMNQLTDETDPDSANAAPAAPEAPAAESAPAETDPDTTDSETPAAPNKNREKSGGGGAGGGGGGGHGM
jgi:hypothetical protein